MSRKSNLAQISAIACTLSLLLSSTAWAAAVNVDVNVPVVHPKVSVVNVKPNSPNMANTTGGGSATGGAGAGKVKLNDLHVTKEVDTASPGFFQDAAAGSPFGKVDLQFRKAGGDRTLGHCKHC